MNRIRQINTEREINRTIGDMICSRVAQRGSIAELTINLDTDNSDDSEWSTADQTDLDYARQLEALLSPLLGDHPTFEMINNILQPYLLQDVHVPLPETDLNKTTVCAFLTVDQGYNDTCCICLDSFEAETEVRQLLCGHSFHSDCILNWFKFKPTCPNCKADQRTFAEVD